MKVTIKFDKHGNVKAVKAPLPNDGVTGRTRMTLAANELRQGHFEQTTGYKLRRFFRRMFRKISRKVESIACDFIVGSSSACEGRQYNA